MATNQTLKDQLATKNVQLQVIVHQIDTIKKNIYKLSQKFLSESAKLQNRINKVQFSRPRGNPSNQWPHCPMTNRIHIFHQNKERKLKDLYKTKDLKRQTFDHEKALLTSKRSTLEAEKKEIQSQVKLINIQLNLPVNYGF